MIGHGCGFVADELAAARVVGVEPRRLAPALASRYHRTTLLLPDARVTVDTGLVWTLLTPRCDGPAEATLPNVAIVETATGCARSSVDRLLWRARHSPTASPSTPPAWPCSGRTCPIRAGVARCTGPAALLHGETVATATAGEVITGGGAQG